MDNGCRQRAFRTVAVFGVEGCASAAVLQWFDSIEVGA